MNAFPVIAAAVLSFSASIASALEIKPYTPQAFEAAQKQGRPVALHFNADWCPSCRAQREALTQLSSAPALDLTLLVVDYDNERDLRRSHHVVTQSTLVVFRGRAERARLAGETSKARIEATLRSAL